MISIRHDASGSNPRSGPGIQPRTPVYISARPQAPGQSRSQNQSPIERTRPQANRFAHTYAQGRKQTSSDIYTPQGRKHIGRARPQACRPSMLSLDRLLKAARTKPVQERKGKGSPPFPPRGGGADSNPTITPETP